MQVERPSNFELAGILVAQDVRAFLMENEGLSISFMTFGTQRTVVGLTAQQ